MYIRMVTITNAWNRLAAFSAEFNSQSAAEKAAKAYMEQVHGKQTHVICVISPK